MSEQATLPIENRWRLIERRPGQGVIDEMEDLAEAIARINAVMEEEGIRPIIFSTLVTGIATIATSATAAWLAKTSSTSFGLMFSPERMMMSFFRPVITR